ncbi:MAG: FtsX-like permease family protein [Bacteroidia bacterium]|nr:FtsX-like permease family protein [Bacteroidia bacterium]
MKFSLYIAKRYLFSKKSQNVINIISAISVFGVAVGTMALITILSVFNGFDTLIQSLFNSFDPDLKIVAVQGKTFTADDERLTKILKQKGVKNYAEVIEENALLRYKDKQLPAIVKGVSDEFSKMTGIDSMVVSGNFMLKNKDGFYAVVGSGVSYFLSAAPGIVSPINIYVPKRSGSLTNPEDAFIIKSIYPSGVFSIQQDFDSKYIIVPIEFARELFEYSKEITSVEIKLEKNTDKKKLQADIQNILGNNFAVKNRFQQNELLFKIMNSEKWAIYLILTFILLIASFNVIGSLTMLIIDKKSDIGILQSLGADRKTIRNIFLFEGWIISFIGAILGLILGCILCMLQQKFGFIKLGGAGQSFIIDAYPVKMQAMDFFYVFSTVVIIGFIAAWYPVRYMTKKYLSLQ